MRNRSYETGARELLQWLENRLADFNNNYGDTLEPHDRRDVQDAYVSLRSNFDGLVKHFIEPARERDATLPESGYHFLWGLMNACYLAHRTELVIPLRNGRTRKIPERAEHRKRPTTQIESGYSSTRWSLKLESRAFLSSILKTLEKDC